MTARAIVVPLVLAVGCWRAQADCSALQPWVDGAPYVVTWSYEPDGKCPLAEPLSSGYRTDQDLFPEGADPVYAFDGYACVLVETRTWRENAGDVEAVLTLWPARNGLEGEFTTTLTRADGGTEVCTAQVVAVPSP